MAIRKKNIYMIKETAALILTVHLDAVAQLYLNELRNQHFPPKRNFLDAHLTLFHKLPDTEEIINQLSKIRFSSFEMEVTELFNLGAGVAYRVQSSELESLRNALYKEFIAILSAQDKQGFRGHITVQNKTSPEEAKALLAALSQDFVPFKVEALGLDLWEYLGGPWQHRKFLPFI